MSVALVDTPFTVIVTETDQSVTIQDVGPAGPAGPAFSGGTYQAYTPTFTNIAVGNGTVSAQYCTVNNFVHAFGSLVFGSTTTIAVNSVMTLPVNTVNTENGALGSVLGGVTYYDVSAFAAYRGTVDGRTAGTNADFRVNGMSIAYDTLTAYETAVSPTALIPFTFATGDFIRWNIYYKSA